MLNLNEISYYNLKKLSLTESLNKRETLDYRIVDLA